MDVVELVLELIEVVFGADLGAKVGDLFHPAGKGLHFGNAEAARGHGRRAETDAGWTEGAALVGGEGIGIESKADFVEGDFVEFAVDAEAVFDIN